MLREIVDVNVRPALIIFEKSWKLRQVSEASKEAKITHAFKKDKKE